VRRRQAAAAAQRDAQRSAQHAEALAQALERAQAGAGQRGESQSASC
jgi:hypothetical protein